MHVAFAPAFCIVMYDTKVAVQLPAISKHWSGVELQKIAVFRGVQVYVGVLTGLQHSLLLDLASQQGR